MKEDIQNRFSQLSNEELIDLVENRYNDYRLEALEVAKEELARRNLSFSETYFEQIKQQREEEAEKAKWLAKFAPSATFDLFYGLLVGLKLRKARKVG